ncbi:MAG: oligoendopeptidase F, partial [Rhodohalobacter sp.]
MSSKNKTETGAENVTWDLSDLYKSPEDPKLLEDKKKLLKEADEFADKYHGRISALSASEFSDALRAYESLIQRAGKIGSYSHLIWSTNTEDAKLGKLLQEANELGSELSQKLVFFDVEWMKLDDNRAEELIHSEELFPWKHYLRVSRMYKDHTLSEDAEQVMSAKSVTGRSAWNRYFDETLGAARFELDGEEMTEQQVLSKLHNPDRELRKRAHESLTETFTELSRSLTFIFNTLLADKYTNDKLRGYESWISSRNLSNQTDSETVEALITAVTGRYELVQRYYKLKKKLLGVDEMFDYDRYAPIAKNRETIKWDRAKSMVLEAYGDFHPRMKSIA